MQTGFAELQTLSRSAGLCLHHANSICKLQNRHESWKNAVILAKERFTMKFRHETTLAPNMASKGKLMFR